MRRGRLRAGDELDFWRVHEAGEHRLLLRAEMKVPGKAWLQFSFAPAVANTTTLRSIASFEPRGLLGRLYWWALYPLHTLIFAGMLKGITQAAERSSMNHSGPLPFIAARQELHPPPLRDCSST